jgi:hypothetical protein
MYLGVPGMKLSRLLRGSQVPCRHTENTKPPFLRSYPGRYMRSSSLTDLSIEAEEVCKSVPPSRNCRDFIEKGHRDSGRDRSVQWLFVEGGIICKSVPPYMEAKSRVSRAVLIDTKTPRAQADL